MVESYSHHLRLFIANKSIFRFLEVADGRFLVRSLCYNDEELYIRLMTMPLTLFQYHPGVTQLFYLGRASAELSLSIIVCVLFDVRGFYVFVPWSSLA